MLVRLIMFVLFVFFNLLIIVNFNVFVKVIDILVFKVLLINVFILGISFRRFFVNDLFKFEIIVVFKVLLIIFWEILVLLVLYKFVIIVVWIGINNVVLENDMGFVVVVVVVFDVVWIILCFVFVNFI